MAEAEPTGEMNEAMLLIVSEIFWPTGDWKPKRDFIMMKRTNESFIKLMRFQRPKIPSGSMRALTIMATSGR